jgi:fucose permease
MVLAVLAIIVIGFLTIVKSKSLALLGIALMGLIFGPIYPNLLGVTLGNPSVVSVVGSAYGIIQAIGLLGASIIPAAIGVYSKGKTIQKSFKIAVVTAVVMLIGIIIMAQV